MSTNGKNSTLVEKLEQNGASSFCLWQDVEAEGIQTLMLREADTSRSAGWKNVFENSASSGLWPIDNEFFQPFLSFQIGDFALKLTIILPILGILALFVEFPRLREGSGKAKRENVVKSGLGQMQGGDTIGKSTFGEASYRYHSIALNTSLITFIVSTFLWIQFDKSTTNFQFVSSLGKFPPFFFQGMTENFSNPTAKASINVFEAEGIPNFYIGIDGLSLFFILLTTFLTPLCILISRNTVKNYVKEYMICFLLLELLLILVFSVLDLVLFYIFFESILMPMMIIIGIWGSRERKIGAAYQLFLYTLFGSVFFLLAILAIYSETGTTDIQVLLTTRFDINKQIILWLAFFASFAVKVPMIPVHTWLPEAHVEAPTAGSVILAGVLLKLGGYGFLRFSIPMFPEASLYYTPMVYVISVTAIIYVSLTTLRQVDMKKIIAYSSVAHMAFVTLGIFTYNMQAIEGSILLMLSHGIVSSALFMCIGVLYDRHKTRIVKYYSGLIQVMPLFMTLFLVFTLANLSLPTTGGFIGEFLILAGLFQASRIITFLAATGMVLGAAYSIWLWNRIACGNLKIYFIKAFADINHREIYMFIPLVFLTFFLGIYPEVVLDTIHMSVKNIALTPQFQS